MNAQHTIARPVRVEGVGLRGGARVAAELRPAPAGAGRRFWVGGVEVPATIDRVVDTVLATSLGAGPARVALVEHLCAALHSMGVDNVDIDVDGEELPALDGSARGWCEALVEAGLQSQSAPRVAIVVAAPVEVRAGSAWARAEPGEGLEIDVQVDFAHPAIGAQRWTGKVDAATFRAEIAWARTFGFLRDAEQLWARGIAKGASLENTLVFDDARLLNPEGLRAADEVVRHKALDLIGDLALLGASLEGRVTTCRAGHALHVSLLRELLARATR